MQHPASESYADKQRIAFTERKRRMLTGNWEIDLLNHMGLSITPDRILQWGGTSLSVNLFRSIVGQLSVLYDRDPVSGNAVELNDEQAALLAEYDPFKRHGHLQFMTVGLGDMFVRIHWTPGSVVAKPGVQLRFVSPCRMRAVDSLSAPGIPVRVEERVERPDPENPNKMLELYEVYSIENPAEPFFRIEDRRDPENVIDVTAHYVAADTQGTRYWTWYDSDGVPYLPWVLYHATDSGKLFNAHIWSELVSGALDIAKLWSYWIHVVRDTAWRQKYGIDVEIGGASAQGAGKSTRRSVATDPSSMLMFQSTGDGSPTISQFDQPTDVKVLADAVLSFARTVAANLNLHASDVENRTSESGVAITLRRDSVRKMQKKFVPSFQRADQELLSKIAKISNAFAPEGTIKLPESDWYMTYTSLPMDQSEMVSEIERAKSLIELGIMSIIDLYMQLNPSVSRDEALADLQQIRRDNAEFMA